MLDVLRRNASSWAIKILLTLIALTFISWGVGTFDEENRDVAASVGGQTISMAELAEAAAGLEKSYREVYGSAFTPEIARELGLKKQAMESLVRRAILLSEAERIGISATDEEVRRNIVSTPAFLVNGQFQESRYRQVLSSNRLTPAEYETAKRTEIVLNKLEGVLAGDALVPETEAKEVFLVSMRKIRLLVVTSDPETAKGVSPPSEAEIAAKYEQTRESFRIPARVKLAVAAFTPDRFAGDVRPSEEEVKAFYEGNSERFRTEEERLISRIVLPYNPKNKDDLRKKATEILLEATKGRAQFEAAAKKYSAGKSGEAWVTRKDAGQGLAEPLFAAAVDTVVGPADTGKAFVLAHLNRIRFPETRPLPQVRSLVLEQIAFEKGKDLATIKAYEAQPKAVSAKDLRKTAAEYGVKVSESGWLGAEGAPGIPPAVSQDAIMLAAGEIGPVKTVGETHYLYQVLAKEDSRIPPLADVRARVAEMVAGEKRVAAARAALLKAVSESKTAAELEANAKKAGLATSSTGWFSPLAEPVPAQLGESEETRKDLSRLSSREQVSRKIYPGAGGRALAVAFLEEKIPTDADWAAARDSYLQGLREQGKNAQLEAFIADRSKELKVEINPDALK